MSSTAGARAASALILAPISDSASSWCPGMANTIYDCYRMNGNRAGFWVRRNVWDRRSSFFVKRIGQQTHGKLPVNASHRCNLPVWGDSYQDDRIQNRNARLEHANTYSWLYLGPEKGAEKIVPG